MLRWLLVGRGSLLVLLLPACRTAAPVVGPSGLGELSLVVEGQTDHPASSTEFWVRPVGGPAEFRFLPREGSWTSEALPGVYDVAAMISTDVNGPWIYASQRVEVRPERTTEVRLTPGDRREARLMIETQSDTPPFLLILARPGTVFPSAMEDLEPRLGQRHYPDDLYFALQSDGRSGLDAIPSLAVGDYVTFVVPIDGIPGDPELKGRTWDLRLGPGTTTLRFEDRLATLRVRAEG